MFQRTRGGPARVIRRYPVLAFFVLALLLSWAGWIPYAAAQAGLLPWRVPAELIWLAEFGPSLAALAVAWATGRPSPPGAILRKLLHWRVRPRWYLLALGLTPALVLLSLAADAALFGTSYGASGLMGWDQRFVERTSAFAPSMGLISGLVRFMSGNLPATALCFVVLAITNGGLSEEIGWRGFALPALEQRGAGPLLASVLIGIMWGVWHTGTVFWTVVLTAPLREGASFAAMYLLQYLLLVIPLSVVYTALMRGTRGILLLAVLLHASYNMTIAVAAAAWPEFPMGTLVVLLWLLVVGLVARSAYRKVAGRRQPDPYPTGA